MKRFLLLLTAVIAISFFMGMGGAVADTPENESNETVTLDIEERIDSDIVLLDWEFNERTDTFKLELKHEGERPTQLTVTESIQQEEGSAQMSIEQERLLPGETTVTIGVTPEAGEAAVVLTTSESVDQGTGIVVSTGIYEPGPWAQTTSTAGWAGGISIAFGMTILAGIKKMRDEHKQPVQVS